MLVLCFCVNFVPRIKTKGMTTEEKIKAYLEEKKLLKNENKTLHDTNARLSISIERLTELLYEKTAKHA